MEHYCTEADRSEAVGEKPVPGRVGFMVDKRALGQAWELCVKVCGYVLCMQICKQLFLVILLFPYVLGN